MLKHAHTTKKKPQQKNTRRKGSSFRPLLANDLITTNTPSKIAVLCRFEKILAQQIANSFAQQGIRRHACKGLRMASHVCTIGDSKAIQSSHDRKDKAMTVPLLVVDDETLVRKFYQRLFRRWDVPVETVATLEEAQEALQSRSFRLIITDLHLTPQKQGEGIQVLETVVREAPDTPAILASGEDERKGFEKSLAVGASATIQKPFGLQEMTDLLRLFQVVPSSPPQ
jgi:CheY-like chemotaxis protein